MKGCYIDSNHLYTAECWADYGINIQLLLLVHHDTHLILMLVKHNILGSERNCILFFMYIFLDIKWNCDYAGGVHNFDSTC